MRLEAIYIRNHFLFDKPQIINLGGKFTYAIDEKNSEKGIKIPNSNFIEGFWGENISLVTAIVGGNGSGKTSILNVFKYLNNNDIKLFFDDGSEGFNEKTKIIYYSPFIENKGDTDYFDASKFSIINSDIEFEQATFSSLFELSISENIKRWMKFSAFSKEEKLLNDIALPRFDSIIIKLERLPINHDDTSNNFIPFFDKFNKIADSERDERENGLKSSKKIYRIRLEIEIIRRVILKVNDILEKSGNKYLNEGFIKDNQSIQSIDFINQISLKTKFYWFLDNAYIEKNSQIIVLPEQEIKDLIEVLIKNIPNSTSSDNWSTMDLNFENSIQIIEVYQKFILAFKKDFNYDKSILLKFSPSIQLSSGESAMYDLFSTFLEIEYNINRVEAKEYDNYLLLLDEADLGFHPLWKKKFVNSILTVLPKVFKNKKIQIIFTTHDPLTLSDIPNSNIVYLEKDKITSKTKVLDNKVVNKKSFGANITDLLADSFFIDNGLIGEFAKSKINDVLNDLLSKKKISKKRKEEIRLMINIIDEPIIKMKLQDLFKDKFDEVLDKENRIKALQDELNKLQND